MNILIAGVAGFIGSHIARRCIREGHTVFGIDDLSTGFIENVPSEVNFSNVNLVCADLNKVLPHNCDVVLNLAGQSSGEKSYEDPVNDLDRNVKGLLRLLEYSVERCVPRILHASSMSVYGSCPDKPISEEHSCVPNSFYGASKLLSEHYLRILSQKIDSCSLRMFNVYGPGQDLKNLKQGMVSIFVAQALEANRIEVRGSLSRFRDLIYIDDVVECWYSIATQETKLQPVLNIGTGIKTSVGDLVSKIQAYFPDCKVETGESTPGDQTGIYADSQKLMQTIPNIKFTGLEEGLSKFIDYCKHNDLAKIQ